MKYARKAHKVTVKPAKAKPRSIGVAQSALAGLREAVAHSKGEKVEGLVVRKVVDPKAIRQKTGLSQNDFAIAFGISASTLRDWEQRRKTPEGPAQVLLRVIDAEPEVVKRVVRAACES
jgi:putative transcriptional regulator